jgi:hypothetical protein
MKVLLIFSGKRSSEHLRVMVNVHGRPLKDKVISLLEENKDREAFDLLVKKAEVDSYLSPGRKTTIRPAVTLIEDLL